MNLYQKFLSNLFSLLHSSGCCWSSGNHFPIGPFPWTIPKASWLLFLQPFSPLLIHTAVSFPMCLLISSDGLKALTAFQGLQDKRIISVAWPAVLFTNWPSRLSISSPLCQSPSASQSHMGCSSFLRHPLSFCWMNKWGAMVLYRGSCFRLMWRSWLF